MRWSERVGRWDESHTFPVDAAIALLLAVVVVPTSTDLHTVSSGPSTTTMAVAAAMVVPLAWRRVAPAASAAAVFAIALLHMLAGVVLLVPADALVLVSIYSVTVHGPVWAYRTAIGGALVGAALAPALAALHTGYVDPASAVGVGLGVAMLALTTFAFALVRRSRREAITTLQFRARQLEVERDQQGQIATAAERARIAREMHDIVAHSLSVIIAQADGGRYAAAGDPAAATRSLTTIAETGRAALSDMRRLLGVLRPGDEPAAATDAPGGAPSGAPGRTAARAGTTAAPVADLTPQPAVGDIEELVDQVRDSGVRVSLVRMGTPRALPPGTGLTVFRICQESLTNILKHAGPTPAATVLLQWAAASLVLEVTDDGRGAAAQSDGAGQGVVGMRERAAMLGGSLTVGPRPGGGYRVRAEIPIPALEETT